MKALPLAVAAALLLSSPALADSCNSAPKPLEGIAGYTANTLILAGARSYYELDSCFILSRRQFGSTVRFGFVNNFDQDVANVGMIFVKSQKIFAGSSPPDPVKLSRGGGWQLQVPPAKAIAELDPSYDRPFKGTLDQWNQLHTTAGITPDTLVANSAFLEPWHAYADSKKRFSSLEQDLFWKFDPDPAQSNFSLTNYLIRFTPDKTYSLIPFTIQLQRNVTEVRIVIGSNLEALVQEYHFFVQ